MTRTNAVGWCCAASASTGSGPDSNQAPPGPYEAVRPSVWMSIVPWSRKRIPGPGCVCRVRDPARREVDPVAAHDPLGERVDLDPAREERIVGLVGGVVELPDERVPVDVRLAVEGGVVRDVVDDAVPAGRLGARLELVEGEPHRGDSSARNAGRSTPG